MLEYDAMRDALYRPFSRPTVFAGGHNYDLIQLGVEGARLAYWPAERDAAYKTSLLESLAVVGFEPPTLLMDASTGTQGFGAYRAADKLALLAFRGTEPDEASDLASDLAFSMTDWGQTGARVHRGFADAAQAILPQVQAWLGTHAYSRLLITGHSLGAAIATLVSAVLKPTQLVAIGSPRVGDRHFAQLLHDIPTHRIVNCCDVVTQVPPELGGYVHVAPATYIDSRGIVAKELGDGGHAQERDRNEARADYVRTYTWRKGCVLIRDLADHAPINYVRAFFPN